MSDDVMFGFGAMRLDLEDENNPSSINYDDEQSKFHKLR